MNLTMVKRRGERSSGQGNPMRVPHGDRLWAGNPLGFNAGDTNLYRYVGNHPANTIDPSGEEPNQEQIDKTWTQKDILDEFDKLMKGLRWPADKIAKYRADLVSLFETANSEEVAKTQTGVNQCTKWVDIVLNRWPRKTTLIKTDVVS